ncbi:hypothetical protein [Methylibium sp.]|uniref:hypothetical protein n=1 Tax=Methylibium sp. TaxID=2067992 RepID=UPI00286B27B4|nr:hypothetical protein [Methylibium sp.]
MLQTLKRWIGGAKAAGTDARALQAWARERGHHVKRVPADDGVVVEGVMHGTSWRLEWGSPQRAYLLERELRLRMDLGLPQHVQMMVISRALAEELEQAAYALFTQDMQTRIDSGMPEEMRWLAMFPKLTLAGMKTVRSRFTAVASPAAPAAAWLAPEVIAQLDAAGRTWLADDEPMVLMTLRGRLYLRIESLQPDGAMLDGALALYEAAARSALAASEGAVGQTQWPTTQSTAWQSHLPSSFSPDSTDEHPR